MTPAQALAGDALAWLAITLAAFAAIGVGVGVGRYIRRDRLDAYDEDERTEPRLTCDIETCTEPSTVEFDGGHHHGHLYICARHAGTVSQWVPVVGVRMPYDQETQP